MKQISKKVLPVMAWIILWQLLAMAVHNYILLAGPLQTAEALIRMAGERQFYLSVYSTFWHIISGFVLGTILGILMAYLAYKKEMVEDFLSPLVLLLKSVPVASFVILLLIWFGNSNISIIICMMVVFPILYLATLEGLKSTDIKLLEMAKVFRMPHGSMLRFIYLPQLKPFWKSSFKLAIGMSFKSGIAAEVIGQPLHSIGNGLYLSKVYLETGELFAWTIVVVFIAFLCEKLIGLLLDRLL